MISFLRHTLRTETRTRVRARAHTLHWHRGCRPRRACGAVHTVHQGMCVQLPPWALMRMWRCKSPRRSVLRPGAMFCSIAHDPGRSKDAACAVRVVRGRHPHWRLHTRPYSEPQLTPTNPIILCATWQQLCHACSGSAVCPRLCVWGVVSGGSCAGWMPVGSGSGDFNK